VSGAPGEREIAQEIRRLVREELRVEEPFEDGEQLAARLDSMMLLALVTAVEDRFLVALTEEDAAATRSLADLARLVARKRAGAPPGAAGAGGAT
jgi:acyl carrier protein